MLKADTYKRKTFKHNHHRLFMLKHLSIFLFLAFALILLSNVAFAQSNVPDVGEGECVPVNPSTGEYDPSFCDNNYNQVNYTTGEKSEDQTKECSSPIERDCNSECQQFFNQCSYTGPRNCNLDCQHLPSYPTYEKEACINRCVADDSAARDAYYDCLDQPNSGEYCVNNCLADVQKSEDDYQTCLAENKKKSENITIPSSNAFYALNEYETVWKNGTENESYPEMLPVIKNYYKIAGCPTLSPTRDAWSAAFVSYIMNKSGINFPVSCTHTNYFKQIQDTPGDCKTYPMSQKEKIKTGDIICRCSGSNCNIDYSNIVVGKESHCDIVTDRSGDSISYVGGNRWSRKLCGDDTSVGCTVVKTNDKPISDLPSSYFGFISCGSVENQSEPPVQPFPSICPSLFILAVSVAFFFSLKRK